MPPSSIDAAEQYTYALVAINNIAESHFFAGRLEDALRVLAHGERIATEPEARQDDLARLLTLMGKIMGYRSSFVTNAHEETLTVLHRAAQAAQQSADQILIASALDALGDAYYAKVLHAGEGNFDEPGTYYQQALALREALADVRGVCESLFHVGLIAERKQDYDAALILFNQVRELGEQHDLKPELAEALRHIGFAYMRADNLPEALRCFQASLSLFEDIGFKLILPFAHLSVGDILQAQGHLSEAMQHYQTGRVQAEAMHLNRAVMQIAYSMGELHAAQNDAVQARECYEQAYGYAEMMAHERGMALCRAKLQGSML